MGAADRPAAEVDVDEQLVAALLADQHGDLAAEPLEVVATGWDNVVVRIGDELAARLPRRALAAALVEHELRWLPVLADSLPLPVPAPVRAGRPALGFPWAWSVVPWFAGDALAEAELGDPVGDAGRLGGFLAALHRPAPADAPVNPFRGGPLGDRTAMLVERLDRLGAAVDRPAVEAAWARALAAPAHAGPPVWLHGDLHPGNLLVREGRLAAVLDFGDLTSGDPATDLAVAWTSLPAAARPALRAAAGGVDDATWDRARGWALSHAVACVATSADDERIAAIGAATLAAVLADAA